MSYASSPAWKRFAAKIEFTDTCWTWTGKLQQGYGRFTENTARPMRNRLAHVVAYEWFIGPVPDGLTIDHLCRNRACVRPSHLEAVTRGENVLRGMGLSAVNARKTTCPYGHPYDIVKPNGRRACRTCKRERERTRYAQKVGAVA